MSDPASLPPGFRFHPTDEELILHYLRNQAASLPCPVSIIAEVDIYKHDPWDLPAKALFGEREWYFFSPRVRKYPKGVRPNRAAASGYWKATGTDKPIHASLGSGSIGVKKALVFYKGRPPKGRKTNWIMHEYRLAEAQTSCNYKPLRFKDSSMRLDDWVLCRIYKKNSKLHQSVPPLMDQEQEDTVSEDIYSSSLQNVEEPSSLGLHKSLSITDLLEDFSTVSYLFDNLPEMQGSELESLVGQPSISQLPADNNSSRNDNNNNNKLVQQKVQEESPAPIAASSTKRNGAAISAEFFNQFDSSQCNFFLR